MTRRQLMAGLARGTVAGLAGMTGLLRGTGLRAQERKGAGAMRWPYPTRDQRPPIVIAHRGASGHRPEHTLAAYRLAIEMGADFIEPDLVITRDGILVARHDIYLSDTTDVADHPEFADRRRRVGEREDWYVSDFTYDELRRLRTRQAFADRDHSYDGREPIPRLEEILALLQAAEREGRVVGMYPEIKQRPFFLAEGLDPVPVFVETLKRAGFTDPARLYLQAFEPETLQALGERMTAPLVQLVDALPVAGEPGRFRPSVALDEAAAYARAVGPSLRLLFSSTGADAGYVRHAHELGLAVHPWTLRDDRLPPTAPGVEAFYEAVFALGVDGVFTDFPDTARR
ncbi:MAG: glycerophosphodiester phosphodiesterase, partial [Alphaproteobacteria bacterium]